MATSTISSYRVAKPLQQPSYTTTANVAPVPVQPAAAAPQPMTASAGFNPQHPYASVQKPAGVDQALWDAYIANAEELTLAGLARGDVKPADVAKTVAQMNSPTGQQTLTTQVNGHQQQILSTPAAARSASTATQAKGDTLVQQIVDNAKGQQTDNTQFFDKQVVPDLNAQRNANGAATELDLKALDQQTAARDKLSGTLSNLSSQQRNLAGGYNAQGSQMYGGYAAGQNALSAQDQGTLSSYLSATDPLMTQLQSRGSNPQDVANQQAALSAATGIANGSLDYQAAQAQLTQAALAQAQLSQYQSNPADWQRQLDSYYKLQGVGNGTLDYRSQAAQAYADPTDVANQRKALGDIQKDVAGGNKDQLDALNLIKSRTGNTATAEEAFLAEQARRKFETEDRGSREAVMHDLSMRGLRSGSAEIANQLAERENLSQDRTLAELGLGANAMQRAQAYTGMQANQANEMRNSQQNALGLQGNLSTNMRNASFDEAYKRGVGADTASANNQSTRFGGITGAASQSNVMRGQNDQVGMFNTGQANQVSMFNTGQANEVGMFNAGQANQTSQFNAGQTNNARANNQATRLGGTQLQAQQSTAIRNSDDAMAMFQDNFASQEATRVGNLAGDRARTGLDTTNQIGTRNDKTYDAGTRMLDTNYGRDKDSISLDIGNAGINYGADTDVATATRGVGSNAAGRAATLTGSSSGVASGRAGVTQGDNQTLRDALMLGVGSLSTDQARKLYGGGY